MTINSAEGASPSHITAYSSIRLSDFPSVQPKNRSSCPSKTECEGPPSVVILKRSTSHQVTNQPANNCPPFFANESCQRETQYRLPHHTNSAHNEQTMFQSLGPTTSSAFNNGDSLPVETQSKFRGSLGGTEHEKFGLKHSEAIALQSIERTLIEERPELEEPVNDWPRPEDNTIAAGGYVWPQWPVQLNRDAIRMEAQPPGLVREGLPPNANINSMNGDQIMEAHGQVTGEYVEPILTYNPETNE